MESDIVLYSEPVLTLPSISFFMLHFNIIVPLTPSSSKWLFPSGFSYQNSLYVFVLSGMSATCLAHLVVLHFIFIILGRVKITKFLIV
jgi:hypothetical protein